MEGLSGRAAMKRSRELVRRSLRTTVAAVVIMFFVPFFVASTIGFFAATTVKSFSNDDKGTEVGRQLYQNSPNGAKDANQGNNTEVNNSEGVSNSDSPAVQVTDPNANGTELNGQAGGEPNPKNPPRKRGSDMGRRMREVIRDALTSLLMLPFQLLIAPLSSIIVALLYLKTRQAGGESMQDLLEQFEESEKPRSNWQKRVRERLIQSGRVTSKS